MKKGLVLEGGAMRGIFTAGVMDEMLEQGLQFDLLAGVSAGAAFGCNYKSGQVGRVLRYNTRFCRDRRYCSLKSLLKTGDLFGVDFCYHELPEKLDPFDNQAYEASPMAFYAVATDVDTGKAVYHLCTRATGKEIEWIRASASMPLVSRAVEIDGQRLLDGGIADAIPVRFAQKKGCEKCVAVLTRPRDYRKKKSLGSILVARRLKDMPQLVSAMETRHQRYNETLEYIRQEEAAGRIFVIAPESKLGIGRIEKDPRKIQQAYEEGRRTAQRQMAALKAFLQEND